ncbi:CYP3A4 [Cordylochernes scorpioides]|uniref:CYP3A4 n=1 Tax=Cordylochernes scorpioides TaxID=51811 RepID=A0ABY6LMX5_9ARAC|nr:CYP3A4 [Cordylochernes scorpioides]
MPLLSRIFGAFTMDVIATTAFGTKLDSHHDPDNPFVKNAQRIFNQEFRWFFIFIFIFPSLLKIITKFSPDYLVFFKDITEKLIKERKENPDVKRYDFLQMLMDELNEEEMNDPTDPNFKDDRQTVFPGLTKDEIAAQCILFFMAGYETTASTLSHCVYMLALNPECQDRLAAEVDNALSAEDVTLDYDTVKTLPYLEAVISETLRLLPPGTRMERQAARNYKLKDTETEIPKDMIVQFPVYAMHRDPEFFPDPEKFDPERFLPENKDNIRPFTYLPFGAGPRNCIAERFALLEVKLCLAKVIQKLQFHRVPETKVLIFSFIS